MATTAVVLAGALVVTVALALTGAVIWGSAPKCPTDAQKKKAFDDLKAGVLKPDQARLVAESWAKAGCAAEAQALLIVANAAAALPTAAAPGASTSATATTGYTGRRPPRWEAAAARRAAA